MLKIGEFSRLSQVSVKTLRFYADMGLLPPIHVDDLNGYRYYELRQLPQLNYCHKPRAQISNQNICRVIVSD